jgi:hypothetical protein
MAEAVASASAAAPVNYSEMYRSMTTPQLISDAWGTERDPRVRDRIMTALLERTRTEGPAWPSAPMAERDEMAGLYPDPEDPEFAARLYGKREFYEARAVVAAVAEGTIDPCSSAAAEAVFELTPVQRIVSRFLHPMTPYQGLLLYHGVGVGKTCTAVTIAEQFLEVSPHMKVIVLVPQALKENFKRTVFDDTKLVWDAGEKQWRSRQCTGTSYLERLGLLTNPDLHTIQYKVEEDRRARYTVTGYQAFANWIERTLQKSLPASAAAMEPAARQAAENDILRRLFSDHLIIVDEAHNLRDTGGEGAGTDAVAKGEAEDAAGGKALNPFLRRIVLNAEGLRLVLMTATPMYNSAPEIVLLLNYLIMNDTKTEKSRLRTEDLFTRDGRLREGASAIKGLEKAARRYVSYMRGENPYTFPLRMRPAAAAAKPATEWPELSATKRPIDLTEVADALNVLPLVFTEPVPGSPPEVALRGATRSAIEAAAAASEAESEEPVTVTDSMLDLRMQMANITYPNSMFGTAGWDNYFNRQVISGGDRKYRIFTPKAQPEGPFVIDSVFSGDGLRVHAPKVHRIVESIKKARGICFVYSRYIKAGALPLAAALERAGFQRRLADGRLMPILAGVPAVAPVCAICGQTAGGAHPADHPHRPACYVLLTSEDELSPNFAGLVRQATAWPADPEWGPLGSNVKVVIGSQVASEGLDLKCVREMHVLDAWYHLNRTDQIIGRAIRYCSHTALRAIETRQGLPAMALNNTLIYLHAMRVGASEMGPPFGTAGEAGDTVSGKPKFPAFDANSEASSKVSGKPKFPAFETADMYAYRIAIEKAIAVGYVQRLLKRQAWDCQLELEAITFTGLPRRIQIDAQGRRMEDYDINDQDFTTYCDYQRCAVECAVSVARTEEEGLHLDSSTFTSSDARKIILSKQDAVRRLFDDDVMVPETVVQGIFSDLPWEISSEALMELIDGRRFRLTRPDGVEGFLIKKAGYVVFQPARIHDTDIPMTLRYARAFQLSRHFMTPRLPVFARADEVPIPGGVKISKVMESAAITGPAPPTAAEEPALSSDILTRWTKWFTFVTDPTEAPWPEYLPATLKIWGWLLNRYTGISGAVPIALRWWFDKLLNYNQQRAFIEFALKSRSSSEPAIAAMYRVLRSDVFASAQYLAYRIYNPDPEKVGAKLDIEYWCLPTSSVAGTAFTPCPSALRKIIASTLGDKPIPIPEGVGTLFGFLAPKAGRIVFKTLDNTKAKKHSTVGAECGNTSNLGEHHPRIRLLHEAGSSVAALAPLMLPDDDADFDTTGAKKRMESGHPEHMRDITHQPLCLYMEFLTRIMDSERVAGRRWFLGAVEASVSGLKGKK